MALEINLAWEIEQSQKQLEEKRPATKCHPRNCVTPGSSVVAESAGFMRGHGTYLAGDELISSVAGAVERVNKLICVKPLKSRYNGEVGDVVIGRITEVQQKRWKVETNGRLDSVLLLSSVNLPGGELRRKSQEDELMMRQYLREGDLISAEVQMVFNDGSLSLHTRSLRYGKLGQGILVKVPQSLVTRRKTHFHNLPCGAGLILGCNGYVWICPTTNEDDSNTGGFIQNLEVIPRQEREVLVRLRNCIALLSSRRVLLYDTTIVRAYEGSLQYEIKDLLRHDVILEVAEKVRNRIALDEAGRGKM